ncbi:MAG: bacteriophage holin [Candidatus Omnitrophica bacterium]|nr:bacteriophage holin [Candidatus Omnitrophota bacterium]
MKKLDARALGLTLGIVWSLSVSIMGILAMTINYGASFVNVLSKLYIGYGASISGVMIGAIWGFFDAGIGGVIIAWLYNKLAR